MNAIILFISFLGTQFLPVNSYAYTFQNHDAIYSAAKSYVRDKFAPQTEYEVELSALDPRLQLIACDQALDAFTQSDTLKPGRNSIGVRCLSKQPWSLYLSATIKVFQNVLILTQAIKRGEIIQETQLSLERKDISQLNSGFITDSAVAVNKQAARNLASGTLLTTRDFRQAILIKRGDSIVISSTKPHLAIQMRGIALMNGVQGQAIRVKNTTSGRIITGTVVEYGLVSVKF